MKQTLWIYSPIINCKVTTKRKSWRNSKLTAILLGCVHMMLQYPPHPDSIMSSNINWGTYNKGHLNAHKEMPIKDHITAWEEYGKIQFNQACHNPSTIMFFKSSESRQSFRKLVKLSPELSCQNLFPHKQQEHRSPSAVAESHSLKQQ